jgi:bacteriocin biosynthesis cyclodehydratase domain-containing protein
MWDPLHDIIPPTSSGGRISLFPVGDFGEAVATRLQRSLAHTFVISDPADAGETPVIMPAWRESRRLARSVDSTPSVPWWLPVVYAHPVIRVGPVLSRRLPGCYDCLTGRELALKKDPRVTESLWDQYDSDDAAGVRGHLPHHAALAAGLALALIADAEGAPGDHRALYTYDVLSGSLTEHVFSPLPRCHRWPAEVA